RREENTNRYRYPSSIAPRRPPLQTLRTKIIHAGARNGNRTLYTARSQSRRLSPGTTKNVGEGRGIIRYAAIGTDRQHRRPYGYAKHSPLSTRRTSLARAVLEASNVTAGTARYNVADRQTASAVTDAETRTH